MVGAANDMRDAHIHIVHDAAHLVHGLTEIFALFPGTQQHEVFDFVIRKFTFTEHRIEELRLAANGNLEANRGLCVR